MQIANARYLVLTLALLVGAGLYVGIDNQRPSGVLRWPSTDSLYSVDSWSASPEQLTPTSNNTQQVTRVFTNATGQSAVLTIFTQHVPKLYGAGAEVPFLGSGFAVTPTTPEVTDVHQAGIGSLAAERGPERWFVVYAYGERRGLLGNGPWAWTLAMLDSIVGRPNDYYKLYLAMREDRSDPRLERDVAGLAQTLFQRISVWYAASNQLHL
jgi:hypothetical protein